MRITFIGAAREVTGSCFLIEASGVRFLVDCGMHQGGREARGRNLEAWPFKPSDIDFVLLTHAHIDHSGLLPRLYALGFRGPVHTTGATADLLSVMLLDSAFIQESEWAGVQRERTQDRRHVGAPTELLYTVAQAQACLEQIVGVDYDVDIQPHPLVRCRFRDAGHILGSAIIELWLGESGRTRKLVFSGDLGQPGRPIVRDPTPIEQAEVLVVESTYGNRLHRPLQETIDELVLVIEDTLRRRQGNIIIPAFALGRTQEEAVLQPQSQQNFTEVASNAILGQAINATVSSRAQKLFGISKIKIDPQAGGPESNPLARVTIEQQVSDKVTLTYITNLTQSAQQIIQVEYNVNRNVSIVAVRDQTGVVSFQVKLRQRKR